MVPAAIWLSRVVFIVVVTLSVSGCRMQKQIESLPVASVPEYRAFGSPQRVNIRGYEGDAMEPFITKDGRYLLFNNRNDPRTNTNLHFAERVEDLTFTYRGELEGVNTAALEGVPSVDRLGNLFFISPRSYKETLSTLYRGRCTDGEVSDVQLVAGVSRRQPGIVTFDAEIAADGDTLFIVDGRFTGGEVPETADIAIAVRDGMRFQRLPSGSDLLKNVNTAALEYAPAVSGDLLELFFTRLDRSGGLTRTVILRAARGSTEAPFGMPEHLSSITGFVEAPTLSSDARSLYYHKREGDRFIILRVTR
jgi:hypothetical protein